MLNEHRRSAGVSQYIQPRLCQNGRGADGRCHTLHTCQNGLCGLIARPGEAVHIALPSTGIAPAVRACGERPRGVAVQAHKQVRLGRIRDAAPLTQGYIAPIRSGLHHLHAVALQMGLDALCHVQGELMLEVCTVRTFVDLVAGAVPCVQTNLLFRFHFGILLRLFRFCPEA